MLTKRNNLYSLPSLNNFAFFENHYYKLGFVDAVIQQSRLLAGRSIQEPKKIPRSDPNHPSEECSSLGCNKRLLNNSAYTSANQPPRSPSNNPRLEFRLYADVLSETKGDDSTIHYWIWRQDLGPAAAVVLHRSGLDPMY
jgi:hypothetical protein